MVLLSRAAEASPLCRARKLHGNPDGRPPRTLGTRPCCHRQRDCTGRFRSLRLVGAGHGHSIAPARTITRYPLVCRSDLGTVTVIVRKYGADAAGCQVVGTKSIKCPTTDQGGADSRRKRRVAWAFTIRHQGRAQAAGETTSLMAHFQLDFNSGLPPADAFARLVDLDAHSAVIPFTTLTHQPPLRRGSTYVARTALGPVGFDDQMVVTDYVEPTATTAGRVAFRETGRWVLGDILLTVAAAPSGGSLIDWQQDIRIRWLPSLFDPVVARIVRAWRTRGPAAACSLCEPRPIDGRRCGAVQ